MVEPPNIGFTGVIWSARTPTQLALDLENGPGVTPMAQAAAAWTDLARSLARAGEEYEQIVARVGEAWRSAQSHAALQRISTLRDWLGDAAATATDTARMADNQAAAYQIARRAMPSATDIAAMQTVAQGMALPGGALGGVLVGATGEIESRLDTTRLRAARVMQTYEAASAPLAAPRHQQPPPRLTSGLAGTETQPMPAVGPTAPLAPAAEPAMRMTYPTDSVDGAGAVEPVGHDSVSVAVAPPPAAMPAMPGVVGPSVAAAEDTATTAGVRGSAGLDEIAAVMGVPTVPPVLGAAPAAGVEAAGAAERRAVS